ncbi:cytochrome c-type biogenesis protein [Haladaptatus paucihalophilus DX253]|uniref:Cytochrome c-type biogenesis protein n=1 Tax=Haladaptatus paucihalophilus DX253 TaxID=797209 RepID=E7QT27_HALPU|nr:cytochrome c biogenesis protein CcsA [Haladaptatus paucihalophilus]EFW92308.1 cytochrome c-type biogenesis protein [Haladaptatus paucihalophilus DX253]SHL59490.1 cytochrome c-type biogenesis protein CcmF [Haladaptatus paucihalophilus DX253]
MTPGHILLYLALSVSLATIILLGRDYVKDAEKYSKYIPTLVGLTAGLLTTALIYLTYQFVTTDYSNAYVWNNTTDYLPLLYRITGVYAGNEGSVLLWATLASIVAFWAARMRGVSGQNRKLVQGITMGIVSFFSVMLVIQSPFNTITQEFPQAVPGFVPATGRGLNPLLVDPYMAIHPPVMFVSYALLTVPFAIGSAHFISLHRGQQGLFKKWYGSVLRWLRISWLFLTAAVALGALWSYTVLGWGGIWAWDPVETAIFIPWLFLTATLHAVTNYRPGRNYTVLAPAMTSTVFALAIYTTSIVRSGVFRSVHSFANEGIGLSLLILMAITAFLGVLLPLIYWFGQDGEGVTQDSKWITRSNLLHLAVLGLGTLAFISIWGLTFPLLRDLTTGIEVEVNAKYYNLWSYPIVLLILLLLGFYMDFDVEGHERSRIALGIFTALTIGAAFIKPSSAWQLASVSSTDTAFYRIVGNASVLSVVPPATYVCIAIIKRAFERIPNISRRGQLKEFGITLIHLGVAILVVSLAFTYLFTAQSSVIIQDARNDEAIHHVPESSYSVQAANYSETTKPRNPDPRRIALSSQQVLSKGSSLNGTIKAVHGTITAIKRGPRATVAQLDNSGVWIGLTGENQSSTSLSRGREIVARGAVMWNYVPQADAVVVTDARNVGPVSNPPPAINLTRVEKQSMDLRIYRDGNQIAAGNVGQSRYIKQGGMQVRDVLINRGLTQDTYVIAALNDGTASLTIKRIPLMTPIRIGVLFLLVGMILVLLFDPIHGLTAESHRSRTTVSKNEPTTSD